MPEWIHNRAEHLLAKNPSMNKSQAFAIATQQSHAKGKSPKGYGTKQGKREAKQKYDTPKGDEGTANPGKLDSPKMPGKPKESSMSGGYHTQSMQWHDGGLPKNAATEQTDLSSVPQQGQPEPVRRPLGSSKTTMNIMRALNEMPKGASIDVHAFFEELSKISMIPVGPNTLSQQQQNDPAARLAKSQKVGTPDDPKGPKYKPLNMLKPPKVAMKLAFQTSSFAGGQLYPSPRANPLPVSGARPPSAVAQDPQLKYSGEAGKDAKCKSKKANVQSPAVQLDQAQKRTQRRLEPGGPSAATVGKPQGFGKPLPQ